MIRTMGETREGVLVYDFTLEEIKNRKLAWYWVDFDQPTQHEADYLSTYFNFHPLAIEDCLGRLQRPKMDAYDDYLFFVLHSICQEDLMPEELNLFIGDGFIVTFHFNQLQELSQARESVINHKKKWDRGYMYAAYEVIDKVVDQYFPILYNIEDHLDEIDDQLSPQNVHLSMDYIFEVRRDLLRLRRTIFPMRELLYRMLDSERLDLTAHEQAYFSDIYDHLLRLVEMVDANRELTADIRDSQMSINSDRMNSIMMTLTIVSTVFIPLTFIAGVYGMNFDYMPELHYHYAYPAILIIMGLIALALLIWFKYKGWLGMDKS